MKRFVLLLFITTPLWAPTNASNPSSNMPRTGGGSTNPAYSRSGYSTRFGEAVNVLTVAQALDQIFRFSYAAPGITLTTTPDATVHELGTNLTGVILSAFVVETSSPITAVQYTVNGTPLASESAPSATGGTETYTDTNTWTTTTAYRATAGDGTTTTTSNAITFTFVYPFYYGVGAQALTGVQVQALTKAVQVQGDITTTTSPSSQVYYFAYPQAYGALTSILDQNGFETIAGYTQRSVSLTLADATTQPYYIYEFNNLTSQTNFSNTYKF